MIPIPDEIVQGVIVYDVTQNEIDLAVKSFGYMKNDLSSIKDSYIHLGFHLDEFVKNEYYKVFGFANVNDFAQKNFGLDASQVSRCMSVFSRFSCYNDVGVPSIYLDDKFSDYSYSQLCEMVSMTDNDIKSVTPTMSVREIRDVKKKLKVKKEKIATSQIDEKVIVPADDFINMDIVEDEPEDVDIVPTSVPESEESFSTKKFRELTGIKKINYFVKSSPSIPDCSLLFVSETGKTLCLNDLEASCKFSFMGFDAQLNTFIFKVSC